MSSIKAYLLLSFLLLFSLNVCEAELIAPPIKPVLQWFDSTGQMVDVHWRTGARWIWPKSGDVSPVLQVWIQLPNDVFLSGNSGNVVQLAEPAFTDSDTAKPKILIVETKSPTTTVKLSLRSTEEGVAESSGLLISIDTSRPQLFLHESCARWGLTLLPESETQSQPIFYLSASCSREKNILKVRFHLPAEAYLVDGQDKKIPDSTVKVPFSSSEYIRVATKETEPVYKYELVFNDRPTPREQQKNNVVIVEKKPVPSTTSASSIQFGFDFAPAFTNYPNANAYTLLLGLRAQPVDMIDVKKWEVELRGPVPPEGALSLDTRLAPKFLSVGHSRVFQILPGIDADLFRFRKQQEISRFYWGPEVVLSLRNEHSSLDGHAYDFRLSAKPLLNSTPVGYDLGLSYSLELVRDFLNKKRIDVEAKFRYSNIVSKLSSESDVTTTSLGFIVWF